MNAMAALKLTAKYTSCGGCGSEFIGNGEGTLVIDETFKRTCKCGWSIEVKLSVSGEKG